MAANLRSRAAPLLIPAAFIFMACLFLWPLTLHPNFVPFPARGQYSDLLITHLPNAGYLRSALTRYGQVPLWNAQIFAGQPFFADPLAGLWYPPDWLLLVLPLPLGFNLLFILHLAWAGYGLLRFLQSEGLNRGPALLGALAFAGTPKLIAHIGAGHVSLVFAVAWTPWLLLALKRAAVGGGLKAGAVAGSLLALIFLADVRWAFYAGVLSAAFWLSRLAPFAPARARPGGWPAAHGFAVICLMLAAGLALPLAQFTLRSSREALTLEEAAAFSLPWRYLLGLVIPNVGGFHEWMTYAGVIPLLLAGLGLGRGRWFWALAALAAAAFALGSNFGLFPLLFRLLPGLGFLRVPPRAWFIAALAVCVLAAHGAQRLRDEIIPRLAQRPLLARLPACAPFLIPALMFFTLADLLRVDSTLLTARPLPEQVPAAEWLAAQPGQFRVYSPSYSLPPGDGLEHVDGVNPLQLAAAAKFVAAASGVPANGYSVTLPSFTTDDLSSANAAAVPVAALLGELNVKYIAAEFAIDQPQLVLVQTFGRTRVYENAAYRPRAWVEDGRALVTFWSPNRIEITASGPGRLILSEVMYPGWQARVDGAPAPLEPVDGLLRGVALPAGEHRVEFDFRPAVLRAGLLVTGAGLLALLGILRWAA